MKHYESLWITTNHHGLHGLAMEYNCTMHSGMSNLKCNIDLDTEEPGMRYESQLRETEWQHGTWHWKQDRDIGPDMARHANSD